jgi:hypothetical protein
MKTYRGARRVRRGADGLYAVGGKTYKMLIGLRQQVGSGTAYKTAGGLRKEDLHFNGKKWVSINKFNSSKKENRLKKYGFGSQKGKFGYVRLQ